MIRVEKLQKYFDGIHAVDDVSFSIAKGEVVGLLGPNGAGKTTTMRIITGYLNADGGQATVDGILVDRSKAETKKRIGYLPENAPLYQDLEVVQYLTYISRLRGIPPDIQDKRIKEMIDTCGLGDVLGRPIGNLSKGFKQRVGLASAMIHRPPILILDEPTSGLDPNQIAEIRELIKKIGRERTVVLSTHILQEVEATCSRALIINSGRLVGHGTMEELLHHGGKSANYTVTVKAPRPKVEEGIAKLACLKLDEWLCQPADERQRFTLSGNGGDYSEEIFKWAVEGGFVLLELSRETASLEDVFRELTNG